MDKMGGQKTQFPEDDNLPPPWRKKHISSPPKFEGNFLPIFTLYYMLDSIFKNHILLSYLIHIGIHVALFLLKQYYVTTIGRLVDIGK